MKYFKKKYKRPTNKFKKIHEFFWNFLISKKSSFSPISKQKGKIKGIGLTSLRPKPGPVFIF
jgi:hypothetical protein